MSKRTSTVAIAALAIVGVVLGARVASGAHLAGKMIYVLQWDVGDERGQRADFVLGSGAPDSKCTSDGETSVFLGGHQEKHKELLNVALAALLSDLPVTVWFEATDCHVYAVGITRRAE